MEIEKIKKLRSVLRGQFTKKASLMEAMLSEKNFNIHEFTAVYKSMTEIYDEMSNLDKDIKIHLMKSECVEIDLEKEIETQQTYITRWLTLKSHYSTLTSNEDASRYSPKRNFKLPKLQFITFDGDLKSWLSFWGQFKKIDSDTELDDSDKFHYLLQAMQEGSDVRKLVETFTPNGYKDCLQQLKDRFAREDLLIQIYVRELLAMVTTKVSELTPVYDKLCAQLRALEELGVTKDKYAAFLLPMIESAIPQNLLQIWERTKKINRDITIELSELLMFLKKEVESEQRISLTKKNFGCDYKTDKDIKDIPTASCLFTTAKKDRKSETVLCLWCDKDNHNQLECYRLHKLSIEQRREIIRKKKACNSCLKIGHNWKNCKAFVKCLICNKRHPTVLCTNKIEGKDQNPTPSSSVTSSASTASVHNVILLQTAVVEISYEKKIIPVRVLFDSGSQRSYIKERTAEKLGMKPISKEVIAHSLFDGVQTSSKLHKMYNVNIKSIDKLFSINITAVGKDSICNNIPKYTCNDSKLNDWLRYNNITLTDMYPNCNEIELLIGADFSGLFMTNQILQVPNGQMAIKTKIGWTLQGKQVGNLSNNNLTTSLFCADNDLSRYWALETLGINDPVEMKSKAEVTAEVMSRFKENIIKRDGRYEVHLPFKVFKDNLLPNFERAKNRLDSTTKSLVSCGKFLEYHDVLQEWENQNIIEKIPISEVDHDIGHYLPHRAVIKESSLTSSLRPVFDASAKDKNGLCLNACLEKGINLIELIPNLLIGFRIGAIGITADIQKAFLQISLPPSDREYLKFLWWGNEYLNNLVVYRHCRVVFGLISSPFLLSATLMHHLDNIKGEYQHTAQLLKRSWYVDNCITSLDTEQETIQFIEGAKNIMQEAKFNLRMWVTSLSLNESGQDIIPVLGLLWDTHSDQLYCNTSTLQTPVDVDEITKRELLSLTQKVFDPIGYTAPVMLVPKLILQATWQRQLEWDSPLPSDLSHKFKDWYKYIDFLKKCKIPRRLSTEVIKKCQISLHVFSDASKDGYGAGVLLRSENNNKVIVQLISAKSRVTPPKNISIPRLELLAALMGSRLLSQVRQNINLESCEIFCWTDSSVVLNWIKRELPLNTFVGNRIKEIRQHTNINMWHHIPGMENWADLASRGCNAKVLFENCWWQGPTWLRLPPHQWPHSEVVVDEQQVLLETKKSICMYVETKETLLDRLQTYFSKYSKLIRSVAWIQRFIHNLKNKSKLKSEISTSEYIKAEKTIIKLIQGENEEFIKSSNLTQYHDKDGLLRIKTKLTLSDFPESTRTPYLLPAKNVVIVMMVRQRHEQLQHAGPDQLIIDLRMRFWIIGVRRLVKSVIHSCIICRRYKAKPVQAPAAPLPVERLKCSVPFQTTGVDLAGPLYLRSGDKCWIVLYTCAVYRAVHLEVTRSLSTEAFILTLRRFIARRGRADLIMSDQGTNFHGTSNLLSSLDWEEVQRHSTIHRLSWKMNAPSAAWWGGYWERLIRIMKDLLRRILGKSSVSYEELITVICDCEAVMNGRPLTYIGHDKGDCLEPLTPAHFIQPIPVTDVTDLDQIDAKSLNNRMQYLQSLREQFKQRFKTEYLTLLVQRGKENKDNLEIGDIVLIETEEKRLKWPMGIVEEFFTGKDGIQRTARVRTSIGTKVRPVQRLYKLEVSSASTGIDTHTSPKVPVSQKTPTMERHVDDGVPDQLSVGNSSQQPKQSTRSGRTVKMPSKFDIYV